MKRVLITGTSSGIGKATRDLFLKYGYEVIGLDILTEECVDQFRNFKVDITNYDQLKQIQAILTKEGILLDAIINIAGIHKMASFVENEYEDLKK